MRQPVIVAWLKNHTSNTTLRAGDSVERPPEAVCNYPMEKSTMQLLHSAIEPNAVIPTTAKLPREKNVNYLRCASDTN